MKTFLQSRRSNREIGASETRLLTPNTTDRRISFRTAQPPGSSTNQFFSISLERDSTCARV